MDRKRLGGVYFSPTRSMDKTGRRCITMIQTLSLLGSTGSIGTQALDIIRRLGIQVKALAAYRNIERLEQQIREFRPEFAAVYDVALAKELKQRTVDCSTRIGAGMDGLLEAAVLPGAEMMFNSVVGMVGLRPTLEAIQAKKKIALANKETLVAGGALVMAAARKQGVPVYPVDSEHSAIFQCLQGCPEKKALKKLILTASGGPFFGKSMKELEQVTPEQALKHPNWDMGAKITIDCATMMNKGLEIMEASWLFDMPIDKVDVVVHRESIIHSMIQFEDNSVLAQLGVPDMRIPIQYALTYPKRFESPVKELDLIELGTLTFFAPDEENFLCLKACKQAMILGGTAPAIANGANEQAVDLFLRKKISFLDIGRMVSMAIERQTDRELTDLEDILKADRDAREFVLREAD